MLARTLSSPPLDQLARMGDAHRNPDGWPREAVYLPERLGLNEEHVPALVGIARLWADPDFDPGDESIWAPIHAWRLLGELRAVEAIEPLLAITDVLAEKHDDWYLGEYPNVFGLIGPPAIAPLASFLGNQQRALWARSCAAECLVKITRRNPETRDDVIAVLCDQLTVSLLNDPKLNASLIGALVDADATESAELMQRAFEADRVDVRIVGDWDNVREEMEGRAARKTAEQVRDDDTSPPCPWVFQYMDSELAERAEAKRKHRKKRRQTLARRKTNTKNMARKPR